jgi:hypothetical protein
MVCKIRFLRIGTTLAIAMGMFWNVAAQTLTLDLSAYPKPTTPDGYWTATYNEDSTSIRFGQFVFSHSSMGGDPSGGYWDGSMTSTDELVIGDTNYGPNTAVYFCLDKLKVTKTGGTQTKTVLKTSVADRTVKALEVTDYFPAPSYAGGEVVVLNAKDMEVLKTTVKTGEKIDLSKLPVGEYRLIHGHKHIPIKKVK